MSSIYAKEFNFEEDIELMKRQEDRWKRKRNNA
jgi:hypothetical protein